MARLRPPAGIHVPREAATITIDALLDGPRPRDPEAARVWLELQSTLAAAALGGPFDPRQILRLKTEAARATWLEARAVWARRVLAGDPRVRGD